jgi:hypothetical protein
MSWTIHGYNAKKGCGWVKFTAPGSMKRLELKNRTSVARASISSATGTEAEIHKHLLTVLMPEVEKRREAEWRRAKEAEFVPRYARA